MSLLEYAMQELRLAGYLSLSVDSHMELDMGECVLELIEQFAAQGHSGFSAPFCIELFRRLASYAPLTPLTGADDEWQDMSAYGDEPKWQNKRCSTVFKNSDGTTYDVNAVVFEDADGNRYTDRDSCRPVTFPYMPKQEVVKKHG